MRLAAIALALLLAAAATQAAPQLNEKELAEIADDLNSNEAAEMLVDDNDDDVDDEQEMDGEDDGDDDEDDDSDDTADDDDEDGDVALALDDDDDSEDKDDASQIDESNARPVRPWPRRYISRLFRRCIRHVKRPYRFARCLRRQFGLALSRIFRRHSDYRRLLGSRLS